ncbi:MAG: ABC transporter permease [Anaerolineae bacterium]
MIKLLLRLIAVTRLASKRLWNHPGLTVLALLGIIFAVAMVNSASFFAKAVDQVILDQELAAFSKMTGRPAFSTSIYTFSSARVPISLRDAENLSANHVAATLSGEVGLPVRYTGLEVHSGNMMLRSKEGASYTKTEQDYLESTDVVYIEGVADEMEILDGDPMDEDGVSGDVLDVWMHTRMAEKMGINVGEEFKLGVNIVSPAVTIRVRGFWKAKDVTSEFWFENPDATLQNKLLVRRQDYINHIEPIVPGKTWFVNWHIILDENEVRPDKTVEYIEGFERSIVIINKFLPEARINTPPLDPLKSFVQRGNTLTILLLGFNLPAFGFLLYFLVLTSAIIARWQVRETATLVSRGMRSSSILTLTMVEELILFVLGTPIGIAVGMGLAQLMGQTASFLTFVQRDPLPTTLRGITIPMTLVALFITMMARILPAIQATRQSLIDVERERARPQRSPFWYRAYLDFILLIPTVYAYRQLTRYGTLALLVRDKPEDLYQDPLLILVPALAIITFALLTLRIFPLIMRAIDVIASLTPWATPHLALRQLGRESQAYINPLLLVIVSLALGVYTISMAASLDQWLVDRMYYRAGTDLAFSVYLPDTTSSGPPEATTPVTGEWIPLPTQFEALEGVAKATRVGNYSMSTALPASGNINGRFIAVDRADFSQVGWFRYDFANEPLGGLMNQLALWPNAVLVPEKLFAENHLQIGDEINLLVSINYEFSVSTPFKVAGTYRYFPTVYDDKTAFIGNLDYLTFYIGMVVPHDIWIRLEDGATGDQVVKQIPKLRVLPGVVRDAPAMIQAEQAKFERVGVFGTLSVGFLAAVVMAAMGLLIYTYASLHDRIRRFTILRAVGLQRRQISMQVIMEYLFLTSFGAIAGSLIGAGASHFFVPLFRVTGEKGVPLPTLIPVIAQDKVAQLVVIFVAFIVLSEVVVIARALSQRAYTMLKGVWG